MNSPYSLPSVYDGFGKPGWTPPNGVDVRTADTSTNWLTACGPCGIPVWVWIAGGALLLWALWPSTEKQAEEIERPRRRRRAA